MTRWQSVKTNNYTETHYMIRRGYTYGKKIGYILCNVSHQASLKEEKKQRGIVSVIQLHFT